MDPQPKLNITKNGRNRAGGLVLFVSQKGIDSSREMMAQLPQGSLSPS